MTIDPATTVGQPGPTTAAHLARVVAAQPPDFTIQFVDDGQVAPARRSAALLQSGIEVRPGHLVLVAPRAAIAEQYEMIWRGGILATVIAIVGDQLTYQMGTPPQPPARTRTVRDWRPADEREAIEVGQHLVVAHAEHEPDRVWVLDRAVDGRPQHAARLQADWLALAQPALLADQVDPRQVVAAGYDRIAERYARWVADELADDVRPRYAAYLLDRLPPGAHVLELGCGGGGPVTQQLALRFHVTGVDISARQIERARARIPDATFVHADMTRVEFVPNRFDGVAAFYAFLHLPYGELPDLLRKVAGWLRSDGVLVATLATRHDIGSLEPPWLGVPMYFSGYGPEATRRFVEDAGLAIERLQTETILEAGRPTAFLWLVARKLADPSD